MSATPVRGLIVDDEYPLRVTLEGYLEDRGFDISSAASAEDALDFLEHKPIDIAIVDIRLPGMDGDTFIAEAHRRHPALEFVVCTGSKDYELSESAREIGLREEHVFRKPMDDLSVMVRVIRNLTGEGALRK